jgi:hypothetical protein
MTLSPILPLCIGGIDMRPKIADAFWNPSVALLGRDIGPLRNPIAASLKLEQPPMLNCRAEHVVAWEVKAGQRRKALALGSKQPWQTAQSPSWVSLRF